MTGSLVAKTSASPFSSSIKKTLFDGEELIFDDYPWKKNDKIVFDETCPNWNQRTYMSKPPFYVNYDGKHKHRLVFLSRS